MKEAFGAVYGRYGSPLTKVFGPVAAPRTYLRAIHLLLMFPLGYDDWSSARRTCARRGSGEFRRFA